MVGLVVWCVIAIVLAVLVLRRSNVARILLVISCSVTALLSLLGVASGVSGGPAGRRRRHDRAALHRRCRRLVQARQPAAPGGYPGDPAAPDGSQYGSSPYGEQPRHADAPAATPAPGPRRPPTLRTAPSAGPLRPGRRPAPTTPTASRRRPRAARSYPPQDYPAADGGPAPGSAREVGGREASYALADDVGLLAERPAHQLPPGLGVVVEPLRGDRDDAGALGEGQAELATVGPAEVARCRSWRSRCPRARAAPRPAAARPSQSRSRRDWRSRGQRPRPVGLVVERVGDGGLQR